MCVCVCVCVCGILKERARTRVKFERLSRCRQSGNRAIGQAGTRPGLRSATLGSAWLAFGSAAAAASSSVVGSGSAAATAAAAKRLLSAA